MKSVNEFLKKIRPLRAGLHSVELFGSYARGDSNADSDIDVLVVVDDEEAREEILAAADEAMEASKYSELLSPIIMDLKHYNKIKNSNSDFYFFMNKEGKTLWRKKG